MIHTVKVFCVVNEVKLDIFLKFWSSLAFSMIQQILVIWSLVPLLSLNQLVYLKFLVYVPLMPSLKDFEHYLAGMWNKLNGMIVWIFFGITLLWDWMISDLFQSCGHCSVFQICWHTECSTSTASSFRIWNSSAEIPSPPLALFVVMLPKAHLNSHSRMSGYR